MRFVRYPSRAPRPITPRRLAASKRALQKERDKFPLLTDWVAAQQPTPEERLQTFQEHRRWKIARDRASIAASWRQSRALPADLRAKLTAEWQAGPWPGSHEYLADFLYTRLDKKAKK